MTYTPGDPEREEYEEGLSDLESKQIYPDGSYSSPYMEEEDDDDDNEFEELDFGPELDLPSFVSVKRHDQEKNSWKIEEDKILSFIDKHVVGIFHLELTTGKEYTVVALNGDESVSKAFPSYARIRTRSTPKGKPVNTAAMILNDPSGKSGKLALQLLKDTMFNGNILSLEDYRNKPDGDDFGYPFFIRGSDISTIKTTHLS